MKRFFSSIKTLVNRLKRYQLTLVIGGLATSMPFTSLASMGGGGAGWQFNPALMYLSESTTSSGSTVTRNRFLFDLGVGYKLNSPIYIGALYSYDNLTTASSSTTQDTYASYGPSFGLQSDNFFMTFTYFVASQYDITTSSGTASYTSGNGYQFSFGYLFMAGPQFAVGPEINYRSLHYTNYKSASGAIASADYTYTTLLPYVALRFYF